MTVLTHKGSGGLKNFKGPNDVMLFTPPSFQLEVTLERGAEVLKLTSSPVDLYLLYSKSSPGENCCTFFFFTEGFIYRLAVSNRGTGPDVANPLPRTKM